MTKPISAVSPRTNPPPPANVTPRVTSVALEHLPPAPSSTPAISPGKFTVDHGNGVVTKKPTPLDYAQVKKLMSKARQQIAKKHPAAAAKLYQHVNDLLSSSILDTKALLTSASCYIIQANFWYTDQPTYHDCLTKARDHLEQISKKLWDPNCPEGKSCSFMYSLGCAQLAIHYSSSDEEQHRKTINYFDAAAKLLPKGPTSLRYKILLGQCHANLYAVRREITTHGTHSRRDELIESLHRSRDYLEKAFQQPVIAANSLQYLHALIRSMLVLLIDEERLSSRHLIHDKKINERIEGHFLAAKKLLEDLPEKNCDMLALLGALQYKEASEEHDYFAGLFQAFLNLDKAHDLFKTQQGYPKTCLRLAAGDLLRQMAWVLPIESMQRVAEDFIELVASEPNLFQLVSKSKRHVFYCQRALWNLIELVEKNADSDFAVGTIKIESISLQEIDAKKLLENAKLLFQALQKMHHQPELDQIRSAPDNIKQLNEFHLQTLQELHVLEDLWENDRIDLLSYIELKDLLKADLSLLKSLKKLNFSFLHGTAIVTIKQHMDVLKSILNNDNGHAVFNFLLKKLCETLEIIEVELPKLADFPETSEERIAYNSRVLKIGNLLDEIYSRVHFKHLMIDRLQDYNCTFELEAAYD